jgi:hypothetical protein
VCIQANCDTVERSCRTIGGRTNGGHILG